MNKFTKNWEFCWDHDGLSVILYEMRCQKCEYIFPPDPMFEVELMSPRMARIAYGHQIYHFFSDYCTNVPPHNGPLLCGGRVQFSFERI